MALNIGTYLGCNIPADMTTVASVNTDTLARIGSAAKLDTVDYIVNN